MKSACGKLVPSVVYPYTEPEPLPPEDLRCAMCDRALPELLMGMWPSWIAQRLSWHRWNVQGRRWSLWHAVIRTADESS